MLNAVAPYDWRTHFDARLTSLDPRAPIGGITAGRSRSRHAERSDRRERKSLEVAEPRRLLGITASDNPRRRGDRPAMKITARNGRRDSREVMENALRTTGGVARREQHAFPHARHRPSRRDSLSASRARRDGERHAQRRRGKKAR
jgi:hypothetical protein